MQTLQIVLTLSHLIALHDALRETFLKVTDTKSELLNGTEPALLSHWLQIIVTCVRQRIVDKGGKK